MFPTSTICSRWDEGGRGRRSGANVGAEVGGWGMTGIRGQGLACRTAADTVTMTASAASTCPPWQ
ncbi:hypothetical protein HaLaN_16484 [Haematococcus lacustris]|uniref:Uncharacterized protein n=1 Tax=Haematococcus lacustris TaxID=44745 RepID=A0A699ZA42_HAELA|nr:hypothetical protein HaLaN_16484 [Haematococcus lacustris]